MSLHDHYHLITVDKVREWKEKSESYRIHYDFIGYAKGNPPKPKYYVMYFHQGKEYVLVKARVGTSGAEPRIMQFWPALYHHHMEFGEGTMMCLKTNGQIIQTNEETILTK